MAAAEALSELMKVIEVSGARSIQDVYRTLSLTAKDTLGFKLQANSKGCQSICFVTRRLPRDLVGKQPISINPQEWNKFDIVLPDAFRMAL